MENFDYDLDKIVTELIGKNVQPYPKPSEVDIITYTVTSNVGSPLDLEKLTLGIFLDKDNVRRIKGLSSDGEYITRSVLGECKFKLFNNCSTAVILSETGKEINTKIFTNGELQMTGCTTLEDAKYTSEKLCDAINKGCREALINTEIAKVVKMKICMINSRFKLNFSLDRQILNDLLNKNYSTQIYSSNFDSSKYQGVNVKYKPKKGGKVTILIFQNGKILITGVKSLDNLNEAYDFINDVFKTNYQDVCLSC